MRQNSLGPFVEVTQTSHKPMLHNFYGANQPHPTNPVFRSEFDPIRKAYWKEYAKTFE